MITDISPTAERQRYSGYPPNRFAMASIKHHLLRMRLHLQLCRPTAGRYKHLFNAIVARFRFFLQELKRRCVCTHRLHDVAMPTLVGVLDQVTQSLIRAGLEQSQSRELVAKGNIGQSQRRLSREGKESGRRGVDGIRQGPHARGNELQAAHEWYDASHVWRIEFRAVRLATTVKCDSCVKRVIMYESQMRKDKRSK